MATKRIEATIPFTYLIPETTPEKKTYYYFKGEATTAEEAGQYIAHTSYSGQWIGEIPIGTVDVLFDSVLYKDVPCNNDIGDKIEGEISFERFPFYLACIGTSSYIDVITLSPGHHTFDVLANTSQVFDLTIENMPDSKNYVSVKIDQYIEPPQDVPESFHTTFISLYPGEKIKCVALLSTLPGHQRNYISRISVDRGYYCEKVSGNITIKYNEYLECEQSPASLAVRVEES